MTSAELSRVADSDTPVGPFFHVFGAVGVDLDGDPVSIGGLRQRRLLALLLARAGSVVSVDWLAEHLWDDDDRPSAATAAIRTYMSRLRLALPEAAQPWIETESAGYRFAAPDEAVEHRRFALLRGAAARAREREDPQVALDLLDQALALWRGDPFRELADRHWARAEIERLELDRLELLEERWEVVLALGRHTQITGELAAFTAEHGLRERAARQYALALHRSGRTAEALRIVANFRRTIADQSGLDPSPAMVDLEQALLSGDPSLNVETKGRPLRGYRLIEEIGSGAFSVVWRGVQPSVDREVAIKQIRAGLASQPDFIRRFEAEARMVARLEHPYIVPLIDFWRDPESAYLVMRWLRGGSLENRLDQGPLTLDQTLNLVRQIGGALGAAHAAGIVHRDVKAANILFDEAGNAFLGDFGIAVEVEESAGPRAAFSSGSPAYSAPEQIRREGLGPQADVFSLGVVVFECLTGSLPFPDVESVEDLLHRQVNTPYPSLATLRPDLPSRVCAAVAKATAKSPASRFPSVLDFVEALEAPETVMLEPAEGSILAARGRLTLFATPYKGLEAFDDGDAARFFGRESLVEELLERFDGETVRSRCLVVVGPSGSGKSSVVRAGLMPALRSGAVAGSSEWFSTTMVPGVDPFESLEAALLRIAVNPPQSLLDQLREGERGILRSVRRCLGSDEDRVVVLIDQFEEVFTGQSSQDAADFLSALSVAIDEPTSPLRLVITLRADYYHRPLEHSTFARILKEAAVDVTPLAPHELEQAIVEPARRLGVEFEPGLVARIMAETSGQPSPLPLLQYTLRELFDHRVGNELTIDAYDELGGLTGALAARAEALHADADGAQRAAIRRVFGRLTNPSEESADVRRRVPVADLGDDPGAAWVLDRFGEARLVTFDRDDATREPTVEVAHEALLREWPRLAAWLREDADLLRSAEAVAVAASAWDESGRSPSDLYRGGRLENALDLSQLSRDRLRPVDVEFVEASRAAADAEQTEERRRIRGLRRLVVGVGVALVLALIAGGAAVREQRRADDEATAAREAAVEAQQQTERAELATLISRAAAVGGDDPTVGVLLALEAHRRAPGPDTEQAVLSALRSSTITARIASMPGTIDPTGACQRSWLSPDGMSEFGISGGQMVIRDLLTGAVSDVGSPPAPCGFWFGDVRSNRRFFGSDDGLKMWLGSYDGPFETVVEFDVPTVSLHPSISAAGRLLVASQRNGRPVVLLLDSATGEPVGSPISGGDFLAAAAVNADGSLVAVSFETLGRIDGVGQTLILDGATGDEIFHINTALAAAETVFDDAAGELIVATTNGELVTADIAQQEVVATVGTATTSQILDVTLRRDGLLIVGSQGQIDLVDRRSGPIGQPIEVRNAVAIQGRADGLVMTLSADDRIDTLDLVGNALADRAWDVDPFAFVSLDAGRAVAVDQTDGEITVIELATGERSTVDLIQPDGSRLRPEVVLSVEDGFDTLSFGAGLRTRWENGELAELVSVRSDQADRTIYAGRNGDHTAYINLRGDGTAEVAVTVDRAGELAVLFTIDAPRASSVLPTLTGGVYVIDVGGTLRTYDVTGELLSEVETGVEFVGLMAHDPDGGKLALAAAPSGLSMVDLTTGETEHLPAPVAVTMLAFARNGEFLATASSDGTVRLWDVERQAAAALLLDGTGGSFNTDQLWYDETTDSLWVASSGRLQRIPLDPERWVERGCEIVGRDLTQTEWDRFVPGDEPLRSACN